MRIDVKVLGFCFLAFLACSSASADEITIGTYDTGRCYPFMCNNSGTDIGLSIDYQQVYTAAAFGDPVRINSLSWYYDNIDGGNAVLLGGTYTLYWGYAALGSVNHLSSNLPSNFISAQMPIGTFIVPPGGVNDDPVLSFSLSGNQQFTYDPSLGNLLLEIVVTNQDDVKNGTGNGANQVDDTGAVTSRAYCVTGAGCSADRTGLVTTFGYAQVPEPGTLMTFGSCMIGLAGLVRAKLRG